MTAAELLQSTKDQYRDGVYGWLLANIGYEFPLKLAEDELDNPLAGTLCYLTHERMLYNAMHDAVQRTYAGRYTREQMINMLTLLSVGAENMYSFAPSVTVCLGVTFTISDLVYMWNKTHPTEAPIRYTPVAECDLP